MGGRFETNSFREESLPQWRFWVSRLAGLACFLGAGMSGIALWRTPTALGVVVFGVCVVAGALLVALPEYLRYYWALRESPPLPDGVEAAFEDTYENLRELREALERLGETVAENARNYGDSKSSPGENDEAWKEELEEAVTRLRLDCDSIEDRLRPILPDDESRPSKSLPPGMLAKALSASGRGKGFPIAGNSKDEE